MIKCIVKYSLIISLACVPLLGQTKNDSIDIKAIVKQQILAAKERQNQQILLKPEPYKAEQVSMIPATKADFTDPLYIKIGVLALASFIAVGFVLKRRMKMRKIENRMNLRKNIKAIREEQLVKEMDPRLKSIRKRLCMTSNYLNKPEKEVIIAAKKMSIAKEELMLASRLNNYKVNEKMEVTV